MKAHIPNPFQEVSHSRVSSLLGGQTITFPAVLGFVLISGH